MWARAQAEGTAAFPKGKQVTGMSLRFATARGIPMIVTAWKKAVITCSREIQNPATKNHTTFISAEPTPASGLRTTTRPKGHRT